MPEAQITVSPIVLARDELRTDTFVQSLVSLALRVEKEVGAVSVLIGADEFYHEATDEFVYWLWIDFVRNDTKVRIEFRRRRDPPYDWMPYMSEVCGFPISLGKNRGVYNLHKYIAEKLRQGPWAISPRLSTLVERVRAFLKSLLSRLAKQS